MYNSNELPKRRKIEPDEFADLLCSGEMVMIREPDLDKHPNHRIYRYSPKDIFVYQPKVNKRSITIPYDFCLQGFTDCFVLNIARDYHVFVVLSKILQFSVFFRWVRSWSVDPRVFDRLRTKKSKLKCFILESFKFNTDGYLRMQT